MNAQKPIECTSEQLAKAFEAWDRDYRENPEKFDSIVSHLLKSTPDKYGPRAAVCLVEYLNQPK